jgi:hypothetical protein
MSKGSAELGDPFNSVACPVQEKLVKLIDWHPRIPTVEKLPSFLADYSVRYFTGLEPPQLTLAVRLLYHLFFYHPLDAAQILPSLRKGKTLAIFTPNGETAVSAVTFVERSGEVVILFLATSFLHSSTGMAAFLLSLLLHKMRSRVKNQEVTFYLKTNPEEDSHRYYCEHHKFKANEEEETFPSSLTDAFADEDYGSPLKDYFGEHPGLVWLKRKYEASYVFSKVKTKMREALFTNPYSTNWCEDLSVYAHLSEGMGALTLKQLDHCARDIDARVTTFFNRVSQNKDVDPDSKFSLIPGNPPARVSWLSRSCMVTLRTLDKEIFSLILAWLQRGKAVT